MKKVLLPMLALVMAFGLALSMPAPASADIVGLWHLDEGTGDTAYDSSGNGNDGTITEASWTTSGKFNNALIFDGINDYVQVANDPSLNIAQGTWEAWLKFADLPSEAGLMNPVAKQGQYWIHALDDDSIQVKVSVGTTPNIATTAADFIETDVWYHVVGTYDGETLKLYVNGELKDSNTSPSGSIDGGTAAILAFGTWSSLVDYFKGIIDEVRIWDEALTAEQVEASYNGGVSKTLGQTDADLGDYVGVQLDVIVAYPSVEVVDTLPPELQYIPDTFKVDGVPDTPEVDGNEVSYTLDDLGAYTITFDAQVTSSEAENITVTNKAAVDGVSDSVDLAIHPYEGFTKEVGKSTNEPWSVVPVETDVHWLLRIDVKNILNDNILIMSDIVVKDNLGGDLELHLIGDLERKIPQFFSIEPLIKKTSGRTEKLHLIWGLAQGLLDLEDDEFHVLNFEISTDLNPGKGKKNPEGHQEYTSTGTHYLNSGAVLKFIDSEGTGFQLSAHTPPLMVTAVEDTP
jgi:hypothetical protein